MSTGLGTGVGTDLAHLFWSIFRLTLPDAVRCRATWAPGSQCWYDDAEARKRSVRSSCFDLRLFANHSPASSCRTPEARDRSPR